MARTAPCCAVNSGWGSRVAALPVRIGDRQSIPPHRDPRPASRCGGRPSNTVCSASSWPTPARSSPSAICCATSGPAYVESTHYLRIYVGHLRQKLEDDPAQPRHFLTETGVATASTLNRIAP